MTGVLSSSARNPYLSNWLLRIECMLNFIVFDDLPMSLMNFVSGEFEAELLAEILWLFK